MRNSKKYQPRLSAAFGGAKVPDYAKLESVSIDYGLLEHSKKVAVVPLDTDWNDLGTFKALYEVHPHDAEGNVGTAEYLSCKDNYVHAPGKHVGHDRCRRSRGGGYGRCAPDL